MFGLAQAVGRRPVTKEGPLHPGSVNVGFVVVKLSLGQKFVPVLQLCPCQGHSTDAPHSFIRLSPTLYLDNFNK